MEKINICFVRNSWNYYSLATIFASIEDFDFVNPFFIYTSEIDKFSFSDNTIFCFSLNSIYYLAHKEIIKNIINKLRKKGRYIFIAGGPHCQYSPESLIQDGFDIVVTGNGGEKSIRKILFDIKGQNDLKPIYKDEVDNLNEYKPFPVRYFHYKPIEITRGCPHKCYFCQTSYFLGPKIIERKIENIVKFVQIAFERNIRDFRFISSNAFSYGSTNETPNVFTIEELLKSIRKIIKDKGRIFFGTFPSEVRPDFVTIELMEILKKYVDNKRIIIGAQSGSDRILTLSNRGHNLKAVNKAIEIAIQAGFGLDIDIIIGMPDEKQEDIEETMKLMRKYKNKSVRFHLHYFMPLPGTPWQNKKPVGVPKNILKEIEHLTGLGLVWGNWKKQLLLVAKEY